MMTSYEATILAVLGLRYDGVSKKTIDFGKPPGIRHRLLGLPRFDRGDHPLLVDYRVLADGLPLALFDLK